MGGPDRSLFSAMMAVASGLELGATLERIVRAAADLADAEYAVLGVLGPGGTFMQFIQVGFDDETVERVGVLPSGRGLIGHMVDHPTPLRLDDIGQHPSSSGFPEGHPPMHSFLGVPIRIRDEVFGNLYLTEKRGEVPFTADDEETVLALAASAAVAIENARLFERTRARERWQRAVMEIDNAVLAGADPGDVLTMVAARARRLADADFAMVCLPTQGSELVVEIVEARDASADVSSMTGRVVPHQCLIAEVFRTGQVRVGSELTVAVEFGGTPMRGPVLAIPLRTPERVLGTLVLTRAEGSYPFPPEALELAEGFATQAAVTLVLAESRLEHERLVVFEDRDRIGRDLHDLVIQRLFATGMQLQSVARAADVTDDIAARIEEAVDDLDDTVKEIRQTIFALQHSADERSRGVRSRVLDEVTTGAAALGFTPAVHFTGTVDAMVSGQVADHLIAALREGLSNAARHARASAVSVAVVVDSTSVELTVADDGIGPPEGGRRSGLANLAARAEDLGGEFTVAQRAGGGTLLTWRAPLGDG